MKYSIVMTYINRKKQLDNTLYSISLSSLDKKEYEIIIVDDNSKTEDNVHEIIQKYENILNIKYLKIKQNNKTHFNSCIAFNHGFSLAMGENIIIQNAECLHNGDLLQYCEQQIKQNLKDNYYVFSCYSLTHESFEKINNIEKNENFIENINKNIIIRNVGHGGPEAPHCHCDAWYVHPVYRQAEHHFCSIISYENLKKINGFDEKYMFGPGWDDGEFSFRIEKLLKINTLSADDVYVMHQWHESSLDFDYKINQDLYWNMTRIADTYRANNTKEILR